MCTLALNKNRFTSQERADRGLLALKLLRSMAKRHLRPNVVTYSAAIRACKADWPMAIGLLERLLSESLGAQKTFSFQRV